MSSRRTLDVYELLPVLYRMLDQEQGYPLRALLEIVGEQAEVVREDIAGLWDDFFIETCAEWAVPYIGELVDSQRLPAGARRRAVVAKAIHYRRRKGTLAMLEELARDVTGWGARVQPFADLLGWSQSMEHLRSRTGVDREGYDPGTANTPGTVDLRDPTTLDRLGGPFDHMSHTADVRPMGLGEAHHNLERVGFFLWRLRRYPVRGATACRAAPPNDHGYYFSPLGNPTPLFTRPAPRADGTDMVREIDVPGPIRPGALARDLEEHRNYEGEAALLGEAQNSIYYGPNRSLNILIGDEPVAPDEVVVQNLEDWDRPTPPHKVAVDVRLGRMAFAASAEPTEEVLVNYNYGFSANIGGGPYYKRLPVALRLPAASLNGKDAPENADEEERCRSEGRPGAWVVSGQVLDRQGSPLAGLRVSVFDRDLFWDDRLGETTTDGEGCFEVVYHEEDFRDLIEAAPDLYVRVEDEEGNRLYLSPRVRWEAGRAEYFRIVVPLVGNILKQLLQSGACAFVYNVGRTPVIPDANARPGLLSTNLHVDYTSEAMADTASVPSGPLRQALPDGRVLFHDNQVTLQAERGTHPVAFPAPEVPPFKAGAIALFSSDDVSLQDNQVSTEVAGGNVFANVVALAPTVRASGNRFTELPRQARLSYLSIGKMGITTDNQATHGLFTWATEVVDANNQSLIRERIPRWGEDQGDAR